MTEYLIMQRVCTCGHVTTADLPAGVRGGPACYGLQVAAAATWLASQDVIGIERAADMSALLGVDVSTEFVSACLPRLDRRPGRGSRQDRRRHQQPARVHRAHMLRHLQDVTDIDPDVQVWTVQAADALRVAIHAFNLARRDGVTIDPDLIVAARTKFDQAVACGISINLSRPWPKGNHPGLVLAKRLRRKVSQVWLFTTRADVPPTNNGSETAIRGFKLAEKVSGCWRTLATLRRHCRIPRQTTAALAA